MTKRIGHMLMAAALCLSACESGNRDAKRTADSVTVRGEAELPYARYGPESGQLVYVPVYSHIYYRNAQRQMNLTATLSIRNADISETLTVKRVDYYDSEGVLVRHYLDNPVDVGPLSSRAFVVEEEDTRGGVGANFVVEWSAEQPIVPPVIQAVMITTASTQGISFVTDGYPLPDSERAGLSDADSL